MTKSKTRTKTVAAVDAAAQIPAPESAQLPVRQKESSTVAQTVSAVSVPVPVDADQENEEEKYRAAVALNLCMVSLSQIVDYNDINILKMEYDAILNNINLECIPKDDALLDALKSILDTCHFFTLHEKDKEILKKKQALKLKVGLSGINFLVVLQGGVNPYAAAANLALMIGVAAVNYKTQKAKAEYENEAEEWALEKSALEQLHQLRGALFTAAWRLADRYKYKDEWRLSEKQIKLYDEILADPDPFSRFNRLETIKDKFEAYPLFFYYLAHSAIEAANEEKNREESQNTEFIKSMYLKAERALKSFNEFYSRAQLLREDMVAASAYLDWAEVKFENGELYSALDAVKKAQNLAGFDFAILQNCAFQYLRGIHDPRAKAINKDKLRGMEDQAIKCLKILIANDYNVSVNAKLLSAIYIKHKNKVEYNILKQLVSKRSSFKYRHILQWGVKEACMDQKDAEEALNFFKSDKFSYVIFLYFARSILVVFSDFARACQKVRDEKDTESLREFFGNKEKSDSKQMLEDLYQALKTPFIELCKNENDYMPVFILYHTCLLHVLNQFREKISESILDVDENSRKNLISRWFSGKESFSEKEYSEDFKKLEKSIQSVGDYVKLLSHLLSVFFLELFHRNDWRKLLQKKPEEKLNDIEVRLRLLDFFEEQSELKRKKLLRDNPGFTDITLEDYLHYRSSVE